MLETVPIDFTSLEGINETGYLSVTRNLAQNSPNPFHGVTTIGYQITSPGFVILHVFDVYGTQVAEPVKEIKTAGYYEVVIRQGNLKTHLDLRSGIYFYRLTVNDRVETRRMICLE